MKKNLLLLTILLLSVLSVNTTKFFFITPTRSVYENVTTHEGDLIIDGNEIFIIENCTYIQTGNMYVRDNATLIIRNAELRLNQTSHWQCNIRVDMSAIFETRNATIRNHVSPSYRFGVYFYGNSTPLLIDSKIEKYVFCYFSASVNIQGNVYVYNSEIERVDISWVHNAFINRSTIGSLQFIRGGFLGVHPMIYLLSSNVSWLYFNDFGGTLFAEEAIIESLSLEGVGLEMLGNITFPPGATTWMSGSYTWVKRNFNVISLNKTGCPLEDVKLELYDQSSTLIWSGFTNSSGRANFNLTFIPANYTSTLRLEATKGTSSSTKNVTLISNTPIIITLMPPPSYILTIRSSPTGVTFTVDGVSRTTPWSGTYYEGASVSLEMPETHNGYVCSHWLEDGNPNRVKTVTMDTDITLTGVFESVPVGGKATPINIPMNKPETPVLWIWLSTIILPMVATVVYIKHVKRRKKKR